MAFMNQDRFRLYYEDTGGNGPAVLFLHGAGGNHLSWWQQVPVFAEEYRCVTVDQRGFGQSPDTPGGPGPAALAADAIAALRRKLAAESQARPAPPWHPALGGTFARTQPVRAFLYTQIAGLNAPLPTDFRERLLGVTTPVERYAATRVPTLFLTSDEDGVIWPELSQKVHEHVPGSRFERVEATGHSTYFERPDVFNREVHAFLKGYRP